MAAMVRHDDQPRTLSPPPQFQPGGTPPRRAALHGIDAAQPDADGLRFSGAPGGQGVAVSPTDGVTGPSQAGRIGPGRLAPPAGISERGRGDQQEKSEDAGAGHFSGETNPVYRF